MQAPVGPQTLSACRAQKASRESWHLHWDPDDGMGQIRERRGGMVFQAEAPACAEAGSRKGMELRVLAGSGRRWGLYSGWGL